MPTFEIPLTAAPQRLSIALAGVTYRLTVKWNVTAQCWILDIANADGIDIVTGIPIVAGADLLGQYEYLGFGGQLVAMTDSNADAPPNFRNLGTTGHIYWITNG